MTSKITKNTRNVKVACIECGCMLKFCIRDDIVVGGDGRIACNVPGAVCPDCIESLLDKVADPPGLVCVNELSSMLAQELIQNFTFLLPSSEASKFFTSLFPDVGLEVHNREEEIL